MVAFFDNRRFSHFWSNTERKVSFFDMKLIFSVSRDQLETNRDRIFAIVSECLPGSRAEIDPAVGFLTVELPAGSSAEAATETLRLRLLTIGVSATRIATDYGDEQGYAPHHNTQERKQQKNDKSEMPPIRMDTKKPKTIRVSIFVPILIAAVVLSSVFAFGVGAGFGDDLGIGNKTTLGTNGEEAEFYSGKIALVDQIFTEYGLYDTDGQALLDEMLKAYAEATGDKYAAYYTDEELAELMSDMNGESAGIGISVTEDAETGNILVVQVFPGSPAEAAGVCAGDLIVRIGTIETGENVSDLGYDVAYPKLIGEIGTRADFVVSRNGALVEFSIVRAKFTAVSVTSSVSQKSPNVGVVSITQFDANTPAQFKTEMNALITAGCDRFVFDVRNNPGGEQKSVMAVLSYFLQEGDTIMSVVSKDGSTTYYYAEETSYDGDFASCNVQKDEIGMYRDYPIVVLTNGYTASAGELFTAGLADYDLATVVGTNTYGKGVIQSIISLEQWGYEGGVKLTVGYYAPPSGENYDGKGILPDVVVELDEAVKGKNLLLLTEQEDNQLSCAIATVNAK